MLINLLIVTGIIFLMSASVLMTMYGIYFSYILEQVSNIEAQVEYSEYSTDYPEPGIEHTEIYNEELEHTDTEFDERIALLKEELIRDNFTDVKPRKGTEAIIGAEGIYNLPHDTEAIQRGGDNNVEISE